MPGGIQGNLALNQPQLPNALAGPAVQNDQSVHRVYDDGSCSCSVCSGQAQQNVDTLGTQFNFNDPSQMLQMMMQALMSLIPMMFGMSGGGQQFQQFQPFSFNQQPPAQTQQPVFNFNNNVTQNTAPVIGGSYSYPGINNPELQNSIDALASTPDGRQLLDAAQARGVRITVGQTGASNVSGEYHPDQKLIILRDADNVKTLAHELVHAVSPEDGNSQEEEVVANIIGNRLDNAATGAQLINPNQIRNLTIPLYPELQSSNNILATLSRLGITV